MKKVILVLILAIAVTAQAKDHKAPTYLAVLDFAAEKPVTPGEARLLTDKFVVSLQKTKKYVIMSRTEIQNILKEQKFQQSQYCSDVACAVEYGKILGVRNIITGRMGKVGKTFLVIIHLVDVETSRELKSIDRSYKGEVDQMIPTMQTLAYEIAGLITPAPSPTPAPISKDFSVDLGGGVKLEMVWLPGGTFQMGSPSYESGRDDDEGPVHTVELDGFWLGETEVTMGQFRRFVEETEYITDAQKGTGPGGRGAYILKSDGKGGWDKSGNWRNPGFAQSYDHPVVCVSWNDAKAFCDWLAKNSKKHYILPTEAQWEYASRAGSNTRFCFGDSDSSLGDYAWYLSNSSLKTHPVGGKRPNAFGLYDMHGNVWEWCADWYGKEYYASLPRRNPQGPSIGSNFSYTVDNITWKGKCRVDRGGGWHGNAGYCRSADRRSLSPGFRSYLLGFRVAAVR